MRASFAPFAVPGQKNAVVLITMGLSQPPVTSRTRVDVEMQTNAYSSMGEPKLTGLRHLANVVLVPSRRGDEPRYDLLTDISLPPGRYELRISARRSNDNVSGSLYADIEIPDFENEELSASGVLIELEPAELAAPPNAFDALVPVVPTSNRQFRRGDVATAFMRIYQNAAGSVLPVTVATRITDERDRIVGEGKDRLEVSAFRVGGRAADYRFPIPVSFLPPGRYLLSFDISVGPTKTSRSVQFEVTQR
jgi:hypothetical protein